jgi:membrane-bound lytic murein transglycosylase B
MRVSHFGTTEGIDDDNIPCLQSAAQYLASHGAEVNLEELFEVRVQAYEPSTNHTAIQIECRR